MTGQMKSILTLDSIKKLNFSQNNHSKKDIRRLQLGLQKLGFVISQDEIEKNEFGYSTIQAVKEFQAGTGLQTTGIVDEDTIKKMKVYLEHKIYSDNKTRTKKLHEILEFLGMKIEADEKKKRIYGKSTEMAIKEFQRNAGFEPVDGLLNEVLVNKLKEEELRKRFTTKTQVGKLQRLILKVERISKLG